MPVFNSIIIANANTTVTGGITLVNNYYQIPLQVYTIVSEFYFDAITYSKITISGQAQVTTSGQQLNLYLIKDNNIGSILASSSNILATSPTDFTVVLNSATDGNYQLLAYASNIGDVGDAKINYANLVKS